MKILKNLFTGIVICLIFFSCKPQTTKEPATAQTAKVKADKIEVYYFHYSRRCATCNAVETVSKEAIAEYYGDKVKFIDLNLDEEPGEAKGAELKISGQTLLIVADTTKINLTSEGFLMARTKPEELKQIIKENIDPFL